MESDCGDSFTYEVNGPEAIFVGYGDHHDRDYSHLMEQTLFAPFERLNFSDTHDHCEYDLHIYPSWELEEHYRTNHPELYTALVISVFLGTSLVFILYDYLVTVRQNKVMLEAKKTNAVVASLFPKAVRERMLKDAEEDYSEKWIAEAIGLAVKTNARNWNYVEAILKRWKEEGYGKKQDRRDNQEDRNRYVQGDYADFID